MLSDEHKQFSQTTSFLPLNAFQSLSNHLQDEQKLPSSSCCQGENEVFWCLRQIFIFVFSSMTDQTIFYHFTVKEGEVFFILKTHTLGVKVQSSLDNLKKKTGIWYLLSVLL